MIPEDDHANMVPPQYNARRSMVIEPAKVTKPTKSIV